MSISHSMNNIEEPMSDNSSPRLSFSQCLLQPDNPLSPQLPVNPPNSDFNFSVRAEVSSSADELFSGGKIRPIPLKKSSSDQNPNPVPVNEKGGGKKSSWMFGRSASLNCAGSGMMKIRFSKSYSTGSSSNPNPNPRPQSQPVAQPKRARGSKRSCHFEGNEGNATSNLPLFPKERGLIGFLMCNCVGGGNNRGMEYYCSP